MERTTIIFVRHAQSVYGEDDRIRPLTREGLEDRAIVLETLKDRHIDAFLCSPFKRSIDTIAPTAVHFGMEIRTDERFRERMSGSFGADLLQRRWADFSFAEEGGECLASVQKRNVEALTDVLREYAGKTVVIGTHGTALSTIRNHYDPSFGLADFERIVQWMPYIVEMEFERETLVGVRELAYVDKTRR